MTSPKSLTKLLKKSINHPHHTSIRPSKVQKMETDERSPFKKLEDDET